MPLPSKRAFRLVLALLLSLTALSVYALPAASAQPGAPLAPSIQQADVHAAYLANLGHIPTGTIAGVVRPRGTQVHAAPTAGGCTVNCLVYHGGPVQHSPRVYLLLWGPDWGTDSAQMTTASYLENFYSGLGTTADNWSTINSQYGDTTGHPTFTGSVYQGVWQDTTIPPHGLTQSQLEAEAIAFVNTHSLTDLGNVQIVIASQSNTCPQGFCDGGYCAYHGWTQGVQYTNLPYVFDLRQQCGENYVNSGAAGLRDGFSLVAGHEYAETITDPQVSSGIPGWYTDRGQENADICEWTTADNLSLSSGSFAVQSIWSNAADACALSTLPPTTQTLTVTKSGTGSGTVSSVPTGTTCSTSCLQYPTGTPVTLTASPNLGSKFAGWSGDCTGSSTCSLMMIANHAVTAKFTAVGTVYQETAATFKGAWSKDTCACFAGGADKYASKAGSSATFTFTGKSIQFVSEMATNRGWFTVYLDGKLVGIVSDYSTTSQNAVPVWTKTFAKKAKHTLKIVVSGTWLIPRVDVDAFIVG